MNGYYAVAAVFPIILFALAIHKRAPTLISVHTYLFLLGENYALCVMVRFSMIFITAFRRCYHYAMITIWYNVKVRFFN